MHNNGQLWQSVLDQLQLQMTQATFDTWVKETWFISLNQQELIIGTKNSFAKDWLENRLYPVISRTVCQILQQPVKLRFVINGEPGSAAALAPKLKPGDIPEEALSTTESAGHPSGKALEPAEPPEKEHPPIITSGITPAEEEEGEPEKTPREEQPGVTYARETDFYNTKIEMGRWLAELAYDNQFWQPYLGSWGWTGYRKLLLVWIGSVKKKKDLKLLDPSKPANQAWTPPFRLSYRNLTRKLGSSNAKLVPGGVYECHRSDQARRLLQKPLQECCGAHSPHGWKRLEDGAGGQCFYWRPGLLQQLFDEHLLAIRVSSTGRATVQVWRSLPLLTPAQVRRLDDTLQADHDEWLDEFGHLFGLTLDQWSTFTIGSMVPYMAGWRKGRQCDGQPPQNPFLEPETG
jgi:hypothetical protein